MHLPSAQRVTVDSAVSDATARLHAVGVDTARLDARLLVGHAIGADTTSVLTRPDRVLDSSERESLAVLLERRTRRIPLAQILGVREFWSREFRVSDAVLTPRPDSEALVAAALAAKPDRSAPLRLLDLGTGSGCLLLALLSELPRAFGVGIDISPAAIAVAHSNATGLHLADRAAFVVADWAAALSARFDVVLCNPPYIRGGEIAGLMPEVAVHEPRLALDGGPDGLDAYRLVLPRLTAILAPAGLAVVEIGAGTAEAVGAIATRSRLRVACQRPDLAGVTRCLVLKPIENPS